MNSKQMNSIGMNLKQMNSIKPKTILCDIDGTLIHHCQDIVEQARMSSSVVPLPNTMDLMKKWDSLGYKIILMTGRRESTRAATIKQLGDLGIIYDEIIFNVGSGDRILINDKKPNSTRNTAYAVNVNRNHGIKHLELETKIPTIEDKYLDGNNSMIEKPWGSETLIECNDRYVVKRLYMKNGECCSLQYHELKRETIYVLSGCLKVYIGSEVDKLEEKIMYPGSFMTIEPFTIHRMEGMLDNTHYLETSTHELWDVVRLSDKYNRIKPLQTDKPELADLTGAY